MLTFLMNGDIQVERISLSYTLYRFRVSIFEYLRRRVMILQQTNYFFTVSLLMNEHRVCFTRIRSEEKNWKDAFTSR